MWATCSTQMSLQTARYPSFPPVRELRGQSLPAFQRGQTRMKLGRCRRLEPVVLPTREAYFAAMAAATCWHPLYSDNKDESDSTIRPAASPRRPSLQFVSDMDRRYESPTPARCER